METAYIEETEYEFIPQDTAKHPCSGCAAYGHNKGKLCRALPECGETGVWVERKD